MSEHERVLSEFIDAWNAGRRPRALEYLRRVPPGPERDALADDLSAWLEVAPTPAYDDAARTAIRAQRPVAAALSAPAGPSLLPRLRAAAGLSVADVARGVVRRFGLAAGSEERTADYVGRLERGELDAGGVSRRLLDGLGTLLGVSGSTLAAALAPAAPRPAAAGGTLFRAGAAADAWLVEEIEVISRAALTDAPAPMDELDRLFCGGPDA